MSSSRKFARGDKNYAFFITFSLKFWKIPPRLLIFGKFSNPPPYYANPPSINIWKIFQPPTIPTPPSINDKRVLTFVKFVEFVREARLWEADISYFPDQ